MSSMQVCVEFRYSGMRGMQTFGNARNAGTLVYVECRYSGKRGMQTLGYTYIRACEECRHSCMRGM